MTVYETLDRVMTSDSVTLKLKCGACGHEDEWNRQKALATFGADAVPYLIRRRLICGECFSRDCTEVWI